MEIAKTIKHLRKSAKMTQCELALKSNVTQAYISMIENGNKGAPLYTLEQIAIALDLNVDVIYALSIQSNGNTEVEYGKNLILKGLNHGT